MSETLRKLDDGLWVADRPFGIAGIEIGVRMTAMALGDGSLLLHSPVRIDTELRRALDDLGPVRFLLAPSKVHHLFAASWKAAYPDARLLAAPGLPKKRPRIPFDGVLVADPPQWHGSVEFHLFGGAPYLSEVVLHHAASRTLVLTDLAMNFPSPSTHLATRLFRRAFGVPGGLGPTRGVRFLIRDRSAARASVDRILAWDFDRITVTHGDVVETGGREALRAAYAWL